MTALGKILAIFVFLFSLVWCGLVVTGHVSRTNWKAAYEAERQRSVAAAAAATGFKDEMDKQAKAHAAQIALLTNDVKTRDTQIANLNNANQQHLNANQQMATLINQMTKTNDLTQANLKQANTQNDLLFTKNAQVEKERDTALTAQKNAEANALAIQLQADGIKKQNERYQNQLIAMNDQLKDLRSGANRPGGARVVPVPEGVRATVDKVFDGYVSINLGADAEIREGAELDVVRYGDKPEYLGKITITQVEPKAAVGQFVSKQGPTAKGDALPKAGDTVMKIGK
jgi:hypothetical protein